MRNILDQVAEEI